MAYDFSSLKKRLAAAEERMRGEMSTLRTGRATPSILDNVVVEVYGSRMKINQLANITTEDPKTLRVSPWDMSQASEIEKAINSSDLGLSVVSDEKGVRVIFPDLTSERRTQILKVVKQKLEEARVSARTAREEIWDDIQKKEKAGEITEDDKFRHKDEMQKLVDGANKKFEEIYERKEKEILEK